MCLQLYAFVKLLNCFSRINSQKYDIWAQIYQFQNIIIIFLNVYLIFILKNILMFFPSGYILLACLFC